MGMTWKQLAQKISELSEAQQNTDVTVVESGLLEALPVVPFLKTEDSEEFGLDENHPYLMTEV